MDAERSRMANIARAKSNRLKGKGHPTTADMDYSSDQWEFMSSVDKWKRDTGRQFPKLCELSSIMVHSGFRKLRTA